MKKNGFTSLPMEEKLFLGDHLWNTVYPKKKRQTGKRKNPREESLPNNLLKKKDEGISNRFNHNRFDIRSL